MKAVELESAVTQKSIVRISQNLKAKKSDYSLAVNPVTIAKSVLMAMKKADPSLTIAAKPESALGTIVDPSSIPTDEKTFGEYFSIYEEKVVRGARRLVLTVALNLSRRLDEIKGDYASGIMTYLQENRTYINTSVLGYDKQSHIGHFFGLTRATWRPAQEILTQNIMAKTMTKDQVVEFLAADGITDLPTDEDGNESTVPQIVLEVDTPGEGQGQTRVMTTALRVKVRAKYARLAMQQLTLATNDPELKKEFNGADYLPPGMNEAIKDYRSFILGHNQFLNEHTVMRVHGLTIDALNKLFKRTDDGPADLPLFQIFLDAGVRRIEETNKTDSHGSWLFVLPKTKVAAVRKLIDFKIPQLYNQFVPNEPQYRIENMACPYRAHATYLNGGGGGSVASGMSGISNVSEGFQNMADRYQSLALHYASDKSKSATTPQRVGRPRNSNRNKHLSLVFGANDVDFPALPSKRLKNTGDQGGGNKTYATAATANLTQNSSNDTSTIATNPTSQSLSNEAFEAHLRESIRQETQQMIESSVKSAIVPVHVKMTQLEQEIAQLKNEMNTALAQQFALFTTQLCAQLNVHLPCAPAMQQQALVKQQQALSAIELQQKQHQLYQQQLEWTEVSSSKRKTPPETAENAMMDSDQMTIAQQESARANNAQEAGNSSTAT